ncbi:MAG: GTP-binding protein [Candidatus Avilachnospira sp.]|jgi:putative membrane protein
MVDYINDDEIPVFLINGFLEAGKTQFIRYTMSEDYFQIEGRTLLIVCEEGETDYDAKELIENKTDRVVIEDESELTEERLSELNDKMKPERVVIEFNGMWDPTKLKFPKTWVLYQQITIIDGSTLDSYLANMKALMGPMLKETELVIVNRCDDKAPEELSDWKRKLRPMLQKGSDIVMENKHGEIPLETLPEELPYDINSDIIDIKNEDYGIWFFDCKDNPERYKGKKVSFTAQVMKSESFDKGYFVPGRMTMTCCEADMTFLGYLARYEDADAFEDGSWVKLTAEISIERRKEYESIGPVLNIISMAHTGAVEEPVTF